MQADLRLRLSALLVLSVSMTLTGCGGGGGNSLSALPPTVTLDGSAAKGFLTNADVTVFAITDGARDKVLATTRTDSLGDYQFKSIPQTAGPVLVELVTNDNSFMFDEVMGKIAAPAGLRLRAVVPDIATVGGVHLTPFSDMAAAALEARGNITATAIQTANAAVENQYLGGNPMLGTKPLKVDEFAGASDDARRTLTKSLTALVAAVSQNDATDTQGNPCPADYGARLKCALNVFSQSITLGRDGTTVTMKPGYAASLLAKGIDHLNKGTVKALDSRGGEHLFNEPMHNELGIQQIANKSSDYTITPVDNGTTNDIIGVRTLLTDIKTYASPITQWSDNFLHPDLEALPPKLAYRAFNNVAQFIATLADGLRKTDSLHDADTYFGQSCFAATKVGNATDVTCIVSEEIDLSASLPTRAVMLRITATSGASPYARWSVWQTQCEANLLIDPATKCQTPSTTLTGVVELRTLPSRFQGPVTFHAYGNALGLGEDGSATGSIDLFGTLPSGFDNTDLTGDIAIEGTVLENSGSTSLRSTTLAAGSKITLAASRLSQATFKLAPLSTPTTQLSGTLAITSIPKPNTYLVSYIKPKTLPSAFSFKGGEISSSLNLSQAFTLTSGTLSGAVLNATHYDPDKSESLNNFARATTQISGDFGLADQSTVSLNTTLSRPEFLKRSVQASYSWAASGSTKTLTTSGTINPTSGNALAEITDTTRATKISLRRQAGQTAGTAYRGSAAMGTLDFTSKKLNLKDGSDERLD